MQKFREQHMKAQEQDRLRKEAAKEEPHMKKKKEEKVSQNATHKKNVSSE